MDVGVDVDMDMCGDVFRVVKAISRKKINKKNDNKQGKLKQAILAFEQATKLNPDNAVVTLINPHKPNVPKKP